MKTTLRQDESTFADIVHPLVVRWKLLLAGVLCGILIGAGVSMVMPKQYETVILLNIGLSVDRPLEDPFTVTEIINSHSFQQAVASKLPFRLTANSLRKLIEAKTDTTRQSPWVSVRVRGASPEQAVQLANGVSEEIITRHTRMYKEKSQVHYDYKQELENKVTLLNREVELLKENLRSYSSSDRHDPSTDLLLQNKLNDRETQTILWRRELRDIQSWLSRVHSRNTELVSKPFLPEEPVKPNLTINILVAGLGSAFLMISLILGMDQYRKRSLSL